MEPGPLRRTGSRLDGLGSRLGGLGQLGRLGRLLSPRVPLVRPIGGRLLGPWVALEADKLVPLVASQHGRSA